MNQIVFQAIINDRLPALTTDNIIRLEPINRHLAGDGFSVIYQPDDHASFFDTGSVLVLDITYNHRIKEFCRVDRFHFGMSQGAGQRGHVSLRSFDENLNVYPTLFAQI